MNRWGIAPHFQADDDGGNNGGGGEPPEPAPQQAETKREKTFTQEQVDAIVAQRLARVERKAEPPRKEESSKPEPGPSAESSELARLQAQLAEVIANQKAQEARAQAKEAENALLQALSGIDLSADDMAMVKTIYETKGDINLAKVTAKRLADTSSPPNVEKGFNEPNNGVNPKIGELPPNVADLTKDDVARLQREGRLREIVEKAHAVGAGAVFRPKSFK